MVLPFMAHVAITVIAKQGNRSMRKFLKEGYGYFELHANVGVSGLFIFSVDCI